MTTSAMTTKLAQEKSVLDTYVRAIRKLSRLVPEVDALEAEVAEREAEVLTKIVALLAPLLPKLVGPITLREPWNEGSPRAASRTLEERGVVVERTFSHHREESGRHVHRSLIIAIDERGRFVVVNETARWTEPARNDLRWEVESREVAVTARFAAEHLGAILAGILDALRVRLAQDLDGKRDLEDRLERLEQAERALG